MYFYDASHLKVYGVGDLEEGPSSRISKLDIEVPHEHTDLAGSESMKAASPGDLCWASHHSVATRKLWGLSRKTENGGSGKVRSSMP